MSRIALCCVVLVSLAGCASPEVGRVGDAAVTPLNDFNLVKAPIPAVLAEAQRLPYGLPADASCESLDVEVRALDAVLGADLDAPETEANPSLIERGGAAAADAAVGAVRRTAEGVVPFRGWVRKLSGAERYSRKVEAAIAAGTVRRAFLKGLRAAKPCNAA